ncbi:MAG: sigma-70 region 4 domain-containing protein, partial [Parabacteroides sp.]|nr:sigma-70 region 4 domain-containing protein [Parabacteroides sp.]
ETALGLLPADDRALILLFYWQLKTIEELAEITGQKPTNVKVRLHRIRKKLYVILKEMEDE